MEQSDSEGIVPSRASIRDGKDRVVAEVVALADERGIRLMRGGGTVFALHGLISPTIARFAAMIVDPRRIDELTAALVGAGWAWRPESRPRVLPPTIRSLTREGYDGVLNLYGLIPGFFAGPCASFEQLWALREQMVLAGQSVPVLGKLPTVMFAAHDRLGGQHWTRSTEVHFNYFLAQFRGALSSDERVELQALARNLGAEDEVRRMILGLGLELAPPAHPDESYVRSRLGLQRPGRGDAWLVARLERPRGRRVSFPGVAAASTALAHLLGARRRLGL